MSYLELKSLRAKRGNASIKAELLKEYRILESMNWHYVIIACDNGDSTYGGLYPNGAAAARDEHIDKVKALEEKIRNLCI
ncbi:hypothetical protein [Klebsiella phage vB_KpnM_5N]|jgi:hypothetical protein|nr:hypothetical protein [Klebsiella phage vB_KpnM_5N]